MPRRANHLPGIHDHMHKPSDPMPDGRDQLPTSDHSLPATGDRVFLCGDAVHPNSHGMSNRSCDLLPADTDPVPCNHHYLSGEVNPVPVCIHPMPGQFDDLPKPRYPMPGERADPMPNSDDRLPDPVHPVPGRHNHLSCRRDPVFERGNRLPDRCHSMRCTNHGLCPTADDLPGSHQPNPVPKRCGGYHNLPNSTDQLSETGNVLPGRRSDDLPSRSAPKLWTHFQPTIADSMSTGVHPLPWNDNRVCGGADGVSANHHPMPYTPSQLWSYHDAGHTHRVFSTTNDLPGSDYSMPRVARCMRCHDDAEYTYLVQSHANPMP